MRITKSDSPGTDLHCFSCIVIMEYRTLCVKRVSWKDTMFQSLQAQAVGWESAPKISLHEAATKSNLEY